MKIGQVSKLLGISPSALRFYEKIGVVPRSESHRSMNNYREYSEEDIQTFRMVLSLKESGFRLSDIGPVLSNDQNGCRPLEVAAENQLLILEKTIAELKKKRDGLKKILVQCRETCPPPGNRECIR